MNNYIYIIDSADDAMFYLNNYKKLKPSIVDGYQNALSSILDANITTGLTAVILYTFGTGPIKGFAVTLLAGIACSLFSAIIITRVVIDYLTRNNTEAVSFG